MGEVEEMEEWGGDIVLMASLAPTSCPPRQRLPDSDNSEEGIDTGFEKNAETTQRWCKESQ